MFNLDIWYTFDNWSETWYHSVADLGGARGTRIPPGPNSFNFMHVLGKFGKIICWCPRRLAPPPQGNPGSATVICQNSMVDIYIGYHVWLPYYQSICTMYLKYKDVLPNMTKRCYHHEETWMWNKKCFSALCCASVTRGFCCVWSCGGVTWQNASIKFWRWGGHLRQVKSA